MDKTTTLSKFIPFLANLFPLNQVVMLQWNMGTTSQNNLRSNLLHMPNKEYMVYMSKTQNIRVVCGITARYTLSKASMDIIMCL